jgi:NADPH2:quinone reductase
MRHKRVVVTHYGGPDAITAIEEDIPTPKLGEVRVKVLAAGVSLPDVLAREGVHPETPRVPYTPVDSSTSINSRGRDWFRTKMSPPPRCPAQKRAVIQAPRIRRGGAAKTHHRVSNRIDASPAGQRMLIHGFGGVGTAMLQLARLAGVEMYGTCSAQGAVVVRELGGIPIDYKNADFVKEIHRLTGDGIDAVFDGIGGDNLWRSRDALREGGRVVTYGFQSKMRAGRMASGSQGRHPIRESAELGGYVLRNWFKPGRKSMVPYSIQWLMRIKPAWFRHDLLTLLDLLKQGKIKPLIAQRLPLQDARRAHEMLGEDGVLGKIVLLPNG